MKLLSVKLTLEALDTLPTLRKEDFKGNWYERAVSNAKQSAGAALLGEASKDASGETTARAEPSSNPRPGKQIVEDSA